MRELLIILVLGVVVFGYIIWGVHKDLQVRREIRELEEKETEDEG